MIIGTCSKCQGAVQIPDLWGGTVPPTPTCSNCGAIPLEPHGKTIPMQNQSQLDLTFLRGNRHNGLC